mmetsp:Transcript_83621/g.241943  ORF Transcript_83621/g.241943 Transcript_83621/m.241943 type:complete len:272 (+) Transcript_83621:64-879(+)
MTAGHQRGECALWSGNTQLRTLAIRRFAPDIALGGVGRSMEARRPQRRGWTPGGGCGLGLGAYFRIAMAISGLGPCWLAVSQHCIHAPTSLYGWNAPATGLAQLEPKHRLSAKIGMSCTRETPKASMQCVMYLSSPQFLGSTHSCRRCSHSRMAWYEKTSRAPKIMSPQGQLMTNIFCPTCGVKWVRTLSGSKTASGSTFKVKVWLLHTPAATTDFHAFTKSSVFPAVLSTEMPTGALWNHTVLVVPTVVVPPAVKIEWSSHAKMPTPFAD